MNFIDAIEGTAKSTIRNLLRDFVEDRLDDTEYVRNVKAVLNGAEEFVMANREILCDVKVLRRVLYEYAKELWITNLKTKLEQESETGETRPDMVENEEYFDYYFDYIYAHSLYPK